MEWIQLPVIFRNLGKVSPISLRGYDENSLKVSDIVFPTEPVLSCALLQAAQAPSVTMAKGIIQATEVFEAFFSVASKEDTWKFKDLSRASVCNMSFTLGSFISDKSQMVLVKGDKAVLSKAKCNSWRFAYEPGNIEDFEHNSMMDGEWERTGEYNYVTNR